MPFEDLLWTLISRGPGGVCYFRCQWMVYCYTNIDVFRYRVKFNFRRPTEALNRGGTSPLPTPLLISCKRNDLHAGSKLGEFSSLITSECAPVSHLPSFTISHDTYDICLLHSESVLSYRICTSVLNLRLSVYKSCEMGECRPMKVLRQPNSAWKTRLRIVS